MNITQLKLDNFCQFKEAILDLAHCNIIYGPNGAGKSTILEAVRVPLRRRGQAGCDAIGHPYRGKEI